MPSPEGLQVANKFTIAMPSVAQLGLNTQPFERDNSLACKPCRADQILLEGQLQLVRVTQTEQAPECWHSFQDSVGWAGGDSHVPKTCQNRKGFAAGFVIAKRLTPRDTRHVAKKRMDNFSTEPRPCASPDCQLDQALRRGVALHLSSCLTKANLRNNRAKGKSTE